MKKLSRPAKIAVSILSVFLAAVILLGAVILGGNLRLRPDKVTPPADMKSWMSMIEDDAKITEIAIPGSHDSGSYNMPYVAETQDFDFAGQLARGVRYFDVRVGNFDGEYLMFHGPVSGPLYSDVLADIKAFLKENPTEFLILDYQHFKNGSEEATFKMLEDALGRERLLLKKDGVKDGEYLESLTLGEVRGKCIVVSKYDEKPYIFQRGENEYGGNALCSYYDSESHKKSSKHFVENVIGGYILRFAETHEDTGFFVLQSQLTDGLAIFGPRFREAAHKERMNKYADGLYLNDNLYKTVNVVMRDFIACEDSAYTLKLNLIKEIVKPEKAENYKAMLKGAGV